MKGAAGARDRQEWGRGAGIPRALLPGGPQLTHSARRLRNGDPAPAPREAERPQGADDRAQSTLLRTWDPRCPGVAILALAPAATPPPARVALCRRQCVQRGDSARRGSSCPGTPNIYPPNGELATHQPKGAGWGPRSGRTPVPLLVETPWPAFSPLCCHWQHVQLPTPETDKVARGDGNQRTSHSVALEGVFIVMSPLLPFPIRCLAHSVIR